MKIDPRAEEPARELFGFAIRSELTEFDEKLKSFSDDATLREALRLAMAVSAVVLNDTGYGRRPADERLRETAAILAEIQDDYTLEPDEVYDYLAKCVYGGRPLTEVLPEGAAVTLPFVVAGNLLASHAQVENGQQWWDYLDAIEASIEATTGPTSPPGYLRGSPDFFHSTIEERAEHDTPSS